MLFRSIFSTATTAVVRGIETGDFYETVSSAVLAGSESFKWGAISGAVVGGATEAYRIHHYSNSTEIVYGEANEIPSPQQAEKNALEKYPGDAQISYINGQEVQYGTGGSSRPDIVTSDNIAWEVKCYDLENNMGGLKKTLWKEIGDRNVNLPDYMSQGIILDIEGREYEATFVLECIDEIQDFLDPIYPDIRIEILGAML